MTDEIWFYKIYKWLSYSDLYHSRFVNKNSLVIITIKLQILRRINKILKNIL